MSGIGHVGVADSKMLSPGIRCIIVLTSWFLLFVSVDGNGFFTALAILCISLARDYLCFKPSNKRLKTFKNLAFVAVIIVAILAFLGVFGIFEVTKYYGTAYFGLPVDNIFVTSYWRVGLRYIFYAALILPLCAFIDWLLSSFSTSQNGKKGARVMVLNAISALAITFLSAIIISSLIKLRAYAVSHKVLYWLVPFFPLIVLTLNLMIAFDMRRRKKSSVVGFGLPVLIVLVGIITLKNLPLCLDALCATMRYAENKAEKKRQANKRQVVKKEYTTRVEKGSLNLAPI